MAPNDVFHKTAKGSAEIAARSIKLAPMTRMAMVIINDVKPFSDLWASSAVRRQRRRRSPSCLAMA